MPNALASINQARDIFFRVYKPNIPRPLEVYFAYTGARTPVDIKVNFAFSPFGEF